MCFVALRAIWDLYGKLLKRDFFGDGVDEEGPHLLDHTHMRNTILIPPATFVNICTKFNVPSVVVVRQRSRLDSDDLAAPNRCRCLRF